MATWIAFETAAPELVSHDGELWLAGMTGAQRFDKVRRDPRAAAQELIGLQRAQR